MLEIKARNLLKFSTTELWDILTGDFMLVFDDGQKLLTNDKEVIYSSYGWDYHRLFGNVPLLFKHHVKSVIKESLISASTHLDLFGSCLWDAYDLNVHNYPDHVQFRDDLAKKSYELTNELYNDAVLRLSEYVTSLDILDYVAACNNPVIKKANEEVKPTQASIDQTYAIIKDTLQTDPVLSKNALASAVRSGIANIGQVLQSIGPRGFLSEINSEVFKTPILRGYVHGFRTMYETMIDSRSAAKALYYAKVPLKKVEYFNRRSQLVSQTVRNLHHGDCGTTNYMLCTIEEDELPMYAGSNYLDETTNTLKVIKATDKHLIGKIIKKRAVHHCAHPDPYGICSTCYGELSLSIPANTNIGQINCTYLNSTITQLVLSTKHLDGSSIVSVIDLGGEELKYLCISKDGSAYLFHHDLSNMPVVKLVVSPKAMKNITDINVTPNVDSLHITHYTEISEILIKTIGAKGVESEQLLSIGLPHRLGSFSYEMLNYIKRKNWTFDDRGNYVFDLDDWDYNKPFVQLPMRQHNMLDFGLSVAKQLESTVNEIPFRENIISPDTAVISLFKNINSKLKVNISIVEVVAYATMVVSTTRNNYGLPKPGTPYSLGIMPLTMAGRSLSAALAYERHAKLIMSPASFIYDNRPDHPMDAIVCPEALANEP